MIIYFDKLILQFNSLGVHSLCRSRGQKRKHFVGNLLLVFIFRILRCIITVKVRLLSDSSIQTREKIPKVFLL